MLIPIKRGDNGYRYYDDTSLLRLQQIQVYQQMHFSLDDIKSIVEKTKDPLVALYEQRQYLDEQSQKLAGVLDIINETIKDLEENRVPNKRKMFGFKFWEELVERSFVVKPLLPTVFEFAESVYPVAFLGIRQAIFNDDKIAYYALNSGQIEKEIWSIKIDNISKINIFVTERIGWSLYKIYLPQLIIEDINGREFVLQAETFGIIEPLKKFVEENEIELVDEQNIVETCERLKSRFKIQEFYEKFFKKEINKFTQ